MPDAELLLGDIVPLTFHCDGEETLQPGHYQVGISLLLVLNWSQAGCHFS